MAWGSVIFTLALLGGLELQVNGFPTGAPESACFYMTPRHLHPHTHRKVFPTRVPGLFNITTSSDFYRPDRPIEVTLWGPPFRGFVIAGVEEGSKDWPTGIFYSTDKTGRRMKCLKKGDTITHTNDSFKDQVTMLWYGPEYMKAEQIRFIATVVVNLTNYYVDVKSKFLRLDPTIPGHGNQGEGGGVVTGDPWLAGQPVTENPWYAWNRQYGTGGQQRTNWWDSWNSWNTQRPNNQQSNWNRQGQSNNNWGSQQQSNNGQSNNGWTAQQPANSWNNQQQSNNNWNTQQQSSDWSNQQQSNTNWNTQQQSNTNWNTQQQSNTNWNNQQQQQGNSWGSSQPATGSWTAWSPQNEQQQQTTQPANTAQQPDSAWYAQTQQASGGWVPAQPQSSNASAWGTSGGSVATTTEPSYMPPPAPASSPAGGAAQPVAQGTLPAAKPTSASKPPAAKDNKATWLATQP